MTVIRDKTAILVRPCTYVLSQRPGTALWRALAKTLLGEMIILKWLACKIRKKKLRSARTLPELVVKNPFQIFIAMNDKIQWS